MTDPGNIEIYNDSLFNRFDKIESKYDSGFKQLFLDKRLEIQWIKWRYLISKLPKTGPSEEQLKEFINGKEFSDFFTENMKMLNDLDPNSFLLEGKFMQNVHLMRTITSINPDIPAKFNITKSYFDEFAENFADKSPNERLSCKLLVDLAQNQLGNDDNKAKELLDKLSKYQYEKYIPKARINSMYAQLNVKIGKQAPDFNITTLEGNNIKLSDFKGKFVFIDFWGSWCAPCLREIPHVKTLYSKVSRNKLEIIGLAGNDKEESLKKCIAENEIKYPNALASSTLLSEYGIRMFPTSFLINPDGKIIRMNMRGESELNLIAEEIENYFNKM
jgi:peroxiredoxin